MAKLTTQDIAKGKVDSVEKITIPKRDYDIVIYKVDYNISGVTFKIIINKPVANNSELSTLIYEKLLTMNKPVVYEPGYEPTINEVTKEYPTDLVGIPVTP